MNPLVSIIIPTFNRANLIGETLNSIIAQSFTNMACIFAIDGSVENTLNVMHDYLALCSRFTSFGSPIKKKFIFIP